MAPRANWKGYLKLSLVSCAVALFPATSTSQRTRFNILSRKSGHRVRYDVVDAEIIQPSFSLYDEEVLRATRQWRYQPATKRGYPVEYRRTVDYALSGK